MRQYTVLWSSRSANRKTGNIPQGTIGSTQDQILSSCKKAKCPLLPKKHGGNGQCYAHHGTPALSSFSKTRAFANGKDYALENAIEDSARSAKYIRLADIGDPCVLTRKQVLSYAKTAKAAGFKGQLGYCHAWSHAGKHLKGLLMASCDTLEQVDQAIDAGWRAAVILPTNAPLHGNKTPAGRRIVLCPAQTKQLTCNECGACDATKKGPIIGFPDHGPASRKTNGLPKIQTRPNSKHSKTQKVQQNPPVQSIHTRTIRKTKNKKQIQIQIHRQTQQPNSSHPKTHHNQ